MRKSQFSLEFILIFGIGFLIIILISGIFFIFSHESTSTLNQAQINKIGNEITANIETVYFMGNGNKITYNAIFPEGISNISIHHLNKTISGKNTYFDYLNISYYNKGIILSNIFFTKENYIRFNCTQCSHSINNHGNYTSYYNDTSITNPGNKKIEIYSNENYVDLNFVKK